MAEARNGLKGGVPAENEDEVVGCPGAPVPADQFCLDVGARGPYEVLCLAHKRGGVAP